MRCPDCNKFVGMDDSNDPEVEVEVDAESGTVSGSVRIVNTCAECGTELKEATFEVDLEVPGADEHIKSVMVGDPDAQEVAEGHDLEMEDSLERSSRTEGKGRGTKTFYGASGTFTVKCSCGAGPWAVESSDEIQASSMDELV